MIQAIPANGTPTTLPLSAIILRPQIRTRNGFDETSLKELSASIAEHGLLQPIVVAPTDEGDQFHLIAGERRVLAATMAGLVDVPATIRTGTHAELAAMQAVENLQRENLHVLDIAEGLKAMETIYPKPKDLARAIGKSPAWLSKHRRLAKLTPAVHAAVSEGLADVETITTLDALARIKTEKAAHLLKRCLQEAAEGCLTRELARTCLANAKKEDAPAKDPDTEDDDANDGTTDNGQPMRTITLKLAPDWADKFESLGGLEWLLLQLAKA